ncbi:MAG: stage V sporulation protein AE [Oscillospiraceae bacterium]
MDYLKAFLVGGGICLVGQILIDFTKLTPARILTAFVVSGVALSALGLYKYAVDFAGAGATVPIIGFGHLLYEGVKSAIAEKGAVGVLTGGLGAAAGGISMSLMSGLIIALIFKSKDQS